MLGARHQRMTKYGFQGPNFILLQRNKSVEDLLILLKMDIQRGTDEIPAKLASFPELDP